MTARPPDMTLSRRGLLCDGPDLALSTRAYHFVSRLFSLGTPLHIVQDVRRGRTLFVRSSDWKVCQFTADTDRMEEIIGKESI